MTPPQSEDVIDVGLALAGAFEASGISYPLGGALAYGLWGVPRATKDVDINVFVQSDELPKVVDALISRRIPADLPATALTCVDTSSR